MVTSCCLLGCAPLPIESGREHIAAGRRTWQFARALREANPDTPLDLLLFRGFTDDPPPPRPSALDAGYRVRYLSREEAEDGRALFDLLGRLAPEAMVGATAFGSFLLARSRFPAPLWVDLFGDPLAEAQARSALVGSDEPQRDGWWLASWCLRRGDRFSAVSPDQRLALLGQLGLSGRLSRENVAESLVAVVPPAIDPLPAAEPLRTEPFTIISSGSFGGWFDVETLARAVEQVLAAEPGVRFVATGGEIPDFLDAPWRRFVDLLKPARDRWGERVRLLGRIEIEELEELERTASCGVVAELPLVERELGSVTRCLTWMARGKPIVLTNQSDVGREAEAAGFGLAYPPQDPDALARALLVLARDPEKARKLGARARLWVAEHRSLASTTEPLRQWVRAPVRAADRVHGAADRWASWQPRMLRDQLHLERNG